MMSDALPPLTEREKEVMQLLSTGITYAEIANQLEVSQETIKQHLKNIYRKLGVGNKIAALKKINLL